MNCQIIRDLLPLYCDNVCSRESREAVEKHLAGCADCQKIHEEMKQEAGVIPFASDQKEEIRVLKNLRKRFSRQRLRAVFVTITATLFLVMMLTAAADLEKPVPYTEGLVTAKLAEDTAIDIYYYGDNYAAFYGLSREFDGQTAVFFCCTKNLRAALPPRREGHIVIGNGLFTDFDTGYFRVPRQVDAVYYLAGDYDQLSGLSEAEFRKAAAEAVLVWERS